MAQDGLQALPRTRSPSSDDSIDALADLFLGEALRQEPGVAGRIGPDPAPRLAGGSTVEAIVLGHLPVLGAAWAVQYARTVSERVGGPVALARLTDGIATIELVGTTPPVGPGEHLEGALRLATGHALCWIVGVTQPLETLARQRGLGAVAVLTGADDAAVVACYSALKALAGAVERDRPVQARVAIMGAADSEAQRARQRIESAASRFLGLSAPVVVVPKMSAVVARTLYRGPCRDLAAEFLERVCAAAAKPVARAGAGRAGQSPMAEPVGAGAEPKWGPQRGARAHGSRAIDAGLTAAPASVGASGERELGGVIDGDSLAALIPGLMPIPIRCPYARDVELALDDEHALHAVAGATIDAVESLLVARAWADDHAEILEAADARIDPGRECVAHLVTSDPERAARLLRTSIRVHLVQGERATPPL